MLDLLGIPRAQAGQALIAVSHGTTVATNQLLEGKVGVLGFITTEGYESVLEIARQSVPDGYGNSYFWVKPDRIVPADRVKAVGGRLDHTGAEVRPFDETGAGRRSPAGSGAGHRHHRRLPAALLRQPRARAADARGPRAPSTPTAVVSISSRGAARVPRVRAVDDHAGRRRGQAEGGRLRRLHQRAGWTSSTGEHGVPFYVMKSNGGVLSAAEVVHQPITHRAVRAGRRRAGRGADRRPTPGSAEVLTCDGGGTSTDVSVVLDGEPTLTTEGTVGAYPSKIPMIDVVTVGAGGGSIAWISPEGTLKVGPRSAGADPGPLCYATGRHRRHRHRRAPGARPDPAAPARRRDRVWTSRRPAAGVAALAGRTGPGRRTAPPASWRSRPGTRPTRCARSRCKRGLDVRDFTLTTFGGSGSLLLCRLIDILGLRGVLVPPNPGNVSAFGLLTVDVRNDYVQTAVARHAELDLAEVGAGFDELTAQAGRRAGREGFSAAQHRFVRTADLRYFGQAFEVRVPVPDGELDRSRCGRRWPTPSTTRTAALYGYDFRDDAEPAGRVGQPAGDRHRADPAAGAAPASGAGRDRRAGADRQPRGVLRRARLPADAAVLAARSRPRRRRWPVRR